MVREIHQSYSRPMVKGLYNCIQCKDHKKGLNSVKRNGLKGHSDMGNMTEKMFRMKY